MADLVKPTYRLPTHLAQPLVATVLVPTNRTLTLVARKAHIVMMAMAQKQHEDGRKPAEGFISPLKDILIESGAAVRTRALLKQYLMQMQTTFVEYRPLDLHSAVIESGGEGSELTLVSDPVIAEERIFPLMAEVRILKLKGGDLWVRWFYPPTITEEILKPTRWSQVNLDVVRSMRTYAAVMLYLITVRYQNNPGGVTKRYTVKELDLYLRSKLEPGEGEDADGDPQRGHRPQLKYRTWRRLKEDVVKDAVAEVNETADITIELTEYKHGREVTHVQFRVEKRAIRPVSGAVDVAAVTLAEQLGMLEHQVVALEDEFGPAAVKEGLSRVRRFVEANPGKRPANAFEYLRTTVRNAIAEGKVAASTTVEPLPPIANAQHDWGATEQRERADQDRAFGSIEQEFKTLPVAEQAVWVDQFAQSLPTTHTLLTSKLARARLESGEWQSAMIKRSVLNFYATRKHGEEWLTEFTTPQASPL